MKQSLLFLLLLIGIGAAAQTEQGNYLVGGNVQLVASKENTSVALTPSAGYFFADNFAAGANVTLGFSKLGSGSDAAKSTNVSIGPFVRYYVGQPGVRPFLEGNINFTSEKTKVAGISETLTGLGFFVGPGVAFFLNRNVALEALAGYQHFAYKDEDGSGGFGFKLGFQVYLSRAEVKTVTNTVQ